jgi:hypothetical protein
MPLFTPLAQRISNLPLILCGPLVRRVEPGLVTVWVALKEARKITLELYQGYRSPADPDDTGRSVAFSSPVLETIQVGEHLHLGLAFIETNGLFTPGAIFSYNLFFTKTDSPPQNLISLGLLDEPVLLGFKKGQLPSFVMAPVKLEDLRIAHGSCRKPHGQGRDGLAILAKAMEDDFTNPARANDPKVRPHCLFHTGDQIYADDVNSSLMPLLVDAGNCLMGFVEPLPFVKLPGENEAGNKDKRFPVLPENPSKEVLAREVNWIQASAEQWPPMRRATNYYSGFSGEEDNHLTSFAEFCAAYLFQWCDVLWPETLPDPGALFDEKLKGSTLTAPYLLPFMHTPLSTFNTFQVKTAQELEGMSEEARAQYAGQVSQLDNGSDANAVARLKFEYLKKKKEVEARAKYIHDLGKKDSGRSNTIEFRAGLPMVRRALANTPSIMMFDDHDVTDDWYLTGNWVKRVLANPLGQTIVRNGLLAFSLFQACGNNPKAYYTGNSPEERLISNFKVLLNKYKNGTSAPQNALDIYTESQKINKLLGFDNFEDPPVKWHCQFRLGPAKVYVLDTRTRRDFSDGPDYPPNLLGPKALKDQLPDTSLPLGVELAIVISPAPVLGLAAMEVIGQPIVSRILDCFKMGDIGKENPERSVAHRGHESLDVEAWSINQKGFEDFLKRCAPLKKVLFLSGDVHYGITAEMDYFVKGKPEASRFIQMVSSSFKNVKPEGQLLGVLPAAFAQSALSGGLNRELAEMKLLAWEDALDISKIKFRFQPAPGVYRKPVAGEFPMRYSYALAKKPVLISLRDWPLTYSQLKDAAGNPTGDPVLHERIVFSGTTPAPSYRWRLKILSDDRPDNQRLVTLGAAYKLDPEEDLSADIKHPKYENTLDTVLRRNTFFSRTHLNRFVNWYSHAAIVRFEKAGDLTKAFHCFFFQPDIPDKPFNTAHPEFEPGTLEHPYLQHETSFRNAPESEKPEFPVEKTVSTPTT